MKYGLVNSLVLLNCKKLRTELLHVPFVDRLIDAYVHMGDGLCWIGIFFKEKVLVIVCGEIAKN